MGDRNYRNHWYYNHRNYWCNYHWSNWYYNLRNHWHNYNRYHWHNNYRNHWHNNHWYYWYHNNWNNRHRNHNCRYNYYCSCNNHCINLYVANSYRKGTFKRRNAVRDVTLY